MSVVPPDRVLSRRLTADPRRRLAAEVAELDDVAALEALVAAARRTRMAATAPFEARRQLFPHERAAGTDFARLDAGVRATARAIADRLGEDRLAFLELLGDDLEGRSPAEVVDRLLDIDGPLGLADVDGVADLLEAAELYHRQLLAVAFDDGAEQVYAEALAQGIDPAAGGIPDPALGDRQLGQSARRLASGPLVDLVRILREAAVALPTV